MMDNTVCSLRRRLLLPLLLPLLFACGLFMTAQAQITYLANESFRKALPQGWSAYPASTPTAPTWASDTHVTASGRYAMHGYVPYNAGDTVELVTPFYDCSNYQYVMLKFSHICKVLGSDLCQIFYRENNLSSQWRPIPADAYKGDCKAYKANLAFDHSSYKEWQAKDTFAVPSTCWYREEVFDLSDYAGYSTVAFKFVIKKGTYFGSFIADGWYLEDFRLLVSNDVFHMPAVSFISSYADTLSTTGPFVVNAKVATRSVARIVSPYLHYSGTYRNVILSDSVLMTRIGGDSLWSATIPQHVYGTTIYYYIIGRDSMGNSARCDGSFYLKNPLASPDTNAVAMHSIVNPCKGTVAGKQTVKVAIKNTGISNLLSARIGWSVNGIIQSPVSYKGNLPCDFVDTVTLGTYTQTLDGYDTIVCWVNMPNNVAESSAGDDTLSVVAYGCSSLLNGIYTVGKGSSYDFKDIGEAMSRLTQCGYGGDVELRLAAGVYDTSLDFTGIEDNIGNHRLTVTSIAKNADSVVFMPASGPVVTLGRSAHLMFRDITFSADSAKGNVVLFKSACGDIVFEHCHLKGFRLNGVSTSNALVYSPGQLRQTGIRFTSNRMEFGSYGVYMIGNISNSNSNSSVVTLDSNRFENNYSTAVYMNYVSVTLINNLVMDAEDNTGNYTGLYINSAHNSRIEGNHIRIRGYGSGSHAADLVYCDSTVLFCNNELALKKNGTCYGISIIYPSGLRVVNNSVYIYGNGTKGNNFGIYADNPSSYRCCLHNNNVVVDPKCAGISYPLYLGSKPIPYWDIDYNNWYGGVYMGYVGATVNTLQEFQSAVPTALHESCKLPVFRDTCDLHLRDGARLICPAYAGVDRDKDGAFRFKITGIGCYTSDPDSSNGSLAALFGWPDGNTFAGDTLQPRVVIQNAGLNSITSATIGWRVNGVNRPSVSWTGKLQTGETDTVALGDYTCVAGNNTIEVYLSSIGNLTDKVAEDDTVSAFNYTCAFRMKGRYTVGGTGDFPTLESALSALNTCGMGGPVEFLLASGSYGELSIQGIFPGADSTNTVTIRSAAGNCDSAVIKGGTTVRLQNAGYLLFEEIAIEGSMIGVEMTGNITDVTFRHCRISVPVTTSTSYMAVTINNPLSLGNVRFVGNSIEGGYYGIYISNSSGSNSLILQNIGVVIDSNTIVNAQYGIYLINKCPVLSISHNRIQSVQYGIYATTSCFVRIIEGNRITVTNGNGTANGILCGTAQNAGIDPTLVINNLIRVESSGTAQGIIYNGTQASRMDAHHNSIYVTSSSGTASGIYTVISIATQGTYQDNKITRNLIVAQGSPAYPLNIITTARLTPQQPIQVNVGYNYTKRSWNNLYSTTNVAYVNGAHTSISALQSVTKQDSNSISVEEAKGPFDCPGIPSVTRDINGMARDTATYIGCYHIEPDSDDVALSAITGIDNITAATSTPIKAVVRNAGYRDITDTVTVVFSIDGVRQCVVRHLPTFPLAFNHVDTIPLGSYRLPGGTHRFLAYVSMSKDSKSKNDTLFFERYTCDSVMRGTYIIGNSSQAFCSYDSIEEVFNRMNICGVSGDITLAFESGSHTGGTMTLSEITHVMGNYHLTITSLAGNRDSARIATVNRILLDVGIRNKNITVRDLTLQHAASGMQDGSTLVWLNPGCTKVDILHNNFVMDSCTNARGVLIGQNGGSFAQDVRIAGNRFYGGFSGVLNSSEPITLIGFQRVFIDSNEFYRQGHYGSLGGTPCAIYLTYINVASISHNRIWARSGGRGDWTGIYCSWVHFDSIVGNIVLDTQSRGNASYGMNFSRCNTQGSRIGTAGVVANNAVKVYTTRAGVSEEHSAIVFLHNTVYTLGDTGYCFYANSNGYNQDIRGNLFVAAGKQGQYAFVHELPYQSDYNNYYSNGYNFARIGTQDVYSLSQIQLLAGGNDLHSLSVAPVFSDLSKDLRIKSLIIPRFLPTDITGAKRTSLTCIGAYQSAAEKTDAMLTDFAQTAMTGGNSLSVSVSLVNNGTDTLKSAVIHWVANGVTQTPVNWTGSLAISQNAVVALGIFPVKMQAVNTVKAWVSRPNNSSNDADSGNDTIYYNEFFCNGRMAGLYTVGGIHPDFPTMELAVKALYACGVSGPVIMRLRSDCGEITSIADTIPGTSAANTVTFAADSTSAPVFGNGLVLRNIAYLRFQGITFGDRTRLVVGVNMSGSCRDVVLRECNIWSDIKNNITYYSAFKYIGNGSDYPVEVKLVGNHIAGGYHNINLAKMCGTSANMASASMYIDSNLLEDACEAGLYADQYTAIRSLSHNRIRNRIGNGYYCGLNLGSYVVLGEINGNRIHVDSVSSAYGIRFANNINNPGSAAVPALVANNEIRMRGCTYSYGMHLQGNGSSMNVVHNSIYAQAYDAAYGIELLPVSSTTYSTNLTRNLLVTAGKSSLPLVIPNSYFRNGLREWNNLCSLTDSSVADINGQLVTSVSALRNLTGNDQYTICAKPVFAHLEEGLELADYTGFTSPKTVLVSTDVFGYPRGDTTAMGCYGAKLWDGVNMLVDRIVSPVPIKEVTCFGDSTPVEVVLTNFGRSTANFDASNLKVDLDVTGAISFHYDTLLSSGSLLPAQSVKIRLATIPVMNSGKYHIKVKLAYKGDVLPEDDTLSMVYNASRVEPPYDVDFSTVPDELLNVRNSGSVDWEVVHDSAMVSAFGTGRLQFAGAGNPGASASAVFNAVDIQGCLNPVLSFWYAHGVSSGIRDVLYVFATTDGGASYTTIGRITPNDTSTGWQQYDIDLSRFANASCLSIVFQAISFGGADQSIDRIRITADADAAITLLPVDLGALTACNNDAVPLRAVITNQTALPFAYSSDTVTAEVTGATTQSFSYIYNKQLAGYETDTVTLGNMDLRANGNYYVNVYMQSQDDNVQNDTVSDSTLYIWQDLAIDSIIGIDAQTQHPGGDTVWVSALVRNRSNLEADRFTLRMSLNGVLVAEDTVYAPLSAGDTMTHAMSLPYVVPFADKEQPYYFLELSVTLPCDGDSANDLRSVVGAVHVPDTVDLQLLSIARPADTLGRKKVSPVVRLANIGNADVQDVMLHVEVLDSAMGLLDNISETVNFIRSNDTAEHVFALTYAVPDYDGRYWLRAYVERHADELEPGNDTLMAQFSCKRNNIGIARHDGEGWNLGQNEPNPASSVTAIPFNVPLDGRVVLSVMGVNGQLLHREEIDATAGANRVELQLETLPAGLYYYSLEYRGQRQVRKMTVIK